MFVFCLGVVMRLKTVFIAAAAVSSCSHAAATTTCYSGAFVLEDDRILAIGPSSEGALRYRLIDGSTGRLLPRRGGGFAAGPGWATPPPPVAAALTGSCTSETLSFWQSERSQSAHRVPLLVTNTSFKSGGLTLGGRLVAPAGDAPVPLAVYVHGSENTSAVHGQLDQFMSPANGVAAFVYDKRGTGASEGKYTQDFETLSDDAVAALTEARRLLGSRVAKVGFIGHSQGGWVAPLAATKVNADFVVVAYGLAISPIEEDGAQVRYDLERAGYGPEVLAKAREVSEATAEVMASRFTRGFDKLADVKKKYGKEPWFARVKGDYTFDILRYPAFALKLMGPKRDNGTPWNYDPMPVLRGLAKPMLWVLAGADSDAPSTTTQSILADLQKDHPKLDVAVYPDTTHGIVRFSEDKNGNRTKLSYAASYQPLVLQWVKTGLLTPASDVDLRPGTATRLRGSAQAPAGWRVDSYRMVHSHLAGSVPSAKLRLPGTTGCGAMATMSDQMSW